MTVRHYGPITYTATPVTVSRRAIPYVWGSSFVDVTSSFSFSASGTDLTVMPNSGMFDVNYEYRIEPTSALKSVGVSGEPQVENYTYDFKLFEVYDLSQNGMVDTPDIAEWVNEPVDFNHDEVADSTDLRMLVNEIGN